MGIVYTELRLANHSRPELEEINVTALVDTGALHLCIPEHVAVQLQLQPLQAREVQTADGKSHLDYVAPIRISLLGRECATGALVFGNQVLLGAAFAFRRITHWNLSLLSMMLLAGLRSNSSRHCFSSQNFSTPKIAM